LRIRSQMRERRMRIMMRITMKIRRMMIMMTTLEEEKF